MAKTIKDNSPSFEDFLRANGIDPQTLIGLQKPTPTPKKKNKKKKGGKISAKKQDNSLDIMHLLSQAVGSTGGKGMDDDVPATVEGQEPAALSAGEYVIPADVVALFGDGNSEAGAQVLEQLIAQVRKAKTGKTEQPPAMDELMGLMANG